MKLGQQNQVGPTTTRRSAVGIVEWLRGPGADRAWFNRDSGLAGQLVAGALALTFGLLMTASLARPPGAPALCTRRSVRDPCVTSARYT
jgi:hypothetical protein